MRLPHCPGRAWGFLPPLALADKGWCAIIESALKQVKRKVRQGGKTNGLIRKHAPDNTYVEYEAMTPERKEARIRLTEEADQAHQLRVSPFPNLVPESRRIKTV